MAKTKNKRNAGLADKVHGKRKGEVYKKKLNPFEVHINKEKIKVLGKKSKHDRGLPGVSRAKAIQKRKETLGTEMKLMNKTNAFIDRRIGEKNAQLSAEDRMVARFAAERTRQYSKKNIYNLADDEILTHRGQTLEQIEKFDDPRSSDDEGDEGKKFGGLDDEFVSDGHFGGGVLSRSEKDGAKSHKDLIEQLIAESKKRKAEKQKEKEQTLDLTEKLDSEWKDLQPVVFKRARMEEKEKEGSLIDKLLSQAEKKNADYDKMMRELRFEKRGTPSDGLKNDEKQQKEERARLEQLERERQQRMLGDDDFTPVVQAKGKHRSADDLDDNFELEDEKEFMLAYDNDGKPLVPENILNDYSVPNAKPKFNDGISDTSSDDDGEEGDDESEEQKDVEEKESDNELGSDDESGTEQKDAEGKKSENVQESSDEVSGEEGDEESDDDDSEKREEPVVHKKSTKQSDKKIEPQQVTKKLDSDHKEQTTKKQSINHDTEDISENVVNNKNSEAREASDDEEEEDSSDSEEENEKDDVDDLRDLKESDQSESEGEDEEDKIGSFFDIKEGGEDNLTELLQGKTPSQQATTIQKLIKKYDPGLAQNNKDKLSRLYAQMLQYINDVFSNLQNEGDVIKAFLIFDKIAPFFYDLAHTNKVSTKKFLAELLKEKHDRFKKHPKRVPDLDTLVFFKLVSLLYPTSDFRHPITTPSLIFMTEILTLSRFSSPYSISRGLFITAIILEYIALSKRLVPAAINFLRGILYLCANTSIVNPIQIVPPFKKHRDAKLLKLEEDCSKMAVENKMAASDLVLNEIDDGFKIRCLSTSLSMLKEFFDDYNESEAQEFIFEPHIQLLSRIDVDFYPKKVANVLTGTMNYMKESLEVRTYTHLAPEVKKPKILRLYEPDIQEVFTGNKNAKLPREMAERKRLQSKVKKEMKGALREIRRDKAYIASVKIRQKIHGDNIRKEKVKQIYKDASIQQGELNKLKRMK